MVSPNPMLGETKLGDHLLVVNFDRWCRLERETGLKVDGLLRSYEEGLGFDDVRVWLRVFLVDDLDDEALAALVMAGGAMPGYTAALKAIGQAMNAFFAPRKKEKAGNPPKAA